MRDAFEIYYSVAEIARRLDLSERVVRRRIQEGFFSPPAPEGLGNVKNLDGDLRIPWSGIEHYLRAHSYRYTPQIAEMNRREMKVRVAALERGDVTPRGPFFSPVAARSGGELRRKLAVGAGGNHG